MIRRQDRDTYRCATCERYIPDADLFVTTNKTRSKPCDWATAGTR